jgi:hypothetical protein
MFIKYNTILISAPYGTCIRNLIDSNFLTKNNIDKIIYTSSSLPSDFCLNNNIKIKKYNFIHNITGFIYGIYSGIYTKLLMQSKKLPVFEEIKKNLETENYLPPIIKRYRYYLNWIPSFLNNQIIFRLLKYILETLILIFSLKEFFFLIKNKPNIILFMHFHSNIDKSLFFVAKFLKIKTIGMVHSWDNSTTKFLVPKNFDKVLVWNKFVKNEIINVYSYKDEDVKIVGIPQHDTFYEYSIKSNEKEINSVKEKLKISNNNFIISCFIPSPGLFKFDFVKNFIEDLSEIANHDINITIIIRLHPGVKEKYFEKFKGKKNILLDYPSELYISDTVKKINVIKDNKILNILNISDITINFGSTTSLDAAFFNKPILNVSNKKKQNNFYDGFRWQFFWPHYFNLIRFRGIFIIYNKNDLLKKINFFKNHKNNWIYKRINNIKNQFCPFSDGKCGDRMMAEILN